MSKNEPRPEAPDEHKPARCAKHPRDEEERDAPAKRKPLFRIVPVDPKNTLNFEDTADK